MNDNDSSTLSIKLDASKIIEYCKFEPTTESLKVVIQFTTKILSNQNIPQFDFQSQEILIKTLNKYSSMILESGENKKMALNVLDAAHRLVLQIKNNSSQQNFYLLLTLNNVSLYCLKEVHILQAKKIIKKCVNSFINNQPLTQQQSNPQDQKQFANQNKTSLEAIFLNNLASIYLGECQYEKAKHNSELALLRIEPYIFFNLKKREESDLQGDEQFIQDAVILLTGYLNMGRSLEKLQQIKKFSEENQSGSNNVCQSCFRFYTNGYKISKTFLGKKNKMTEKFLSLAKQNQNQDQKQMNESGQINDNQSQISCGQASLSVRSAGDQFGPKDLYNEDYLELDDNIRVKSLLKGVAHLIKLDQNAEGNSFTLNSSGAYKIGNSAATSANSGNVQQFNQAGSSNSGKKSTNASEQHHNSKFGAGSSLNNSKDSGNSPTGSNNNISQNSATIQKGKLVKDQPQQLTQSQQQSQSQARPATATLQKTHKQSKSQTQQLVNSYNAKETVVQFEEEDVVEMQEKKPENVKKTVSIKDKASKSELIDQQQLQSLLDQQKKQQELKLKEQEDRIKQLEQSFNQMMEENKNLHRDHTEKDKELTKIRESLQQLQQQTSGQQRKKSVFAGDKQPGQQQTSNINEIRLPLHLVEEKNDLIKNNVFSAGSVRGHQPQQQYQANSVQNQSNSSTSDKNQQQQQQVQGSNESQFKNQFKKSSYINSNNYMWQQQQDQKRISEFTDEDILLTQEQMLEGMREIVKKTIHLEGNQYMVAINIQKVQGEYQINFQGEIVENKKPLNGVMIFVDEFKSIIKMMELQDVLPYTRPFKTITTFYDLCSNILFPFVAVNEDLKIEIWPKPPGLIGSSWEIKFMGENCLMYLHHLTKTDFRLVITSKLTGESIRIDINLDESSCKKYLELINDQEKIRKEELADIIKIYDFQQEQEEYPLSPQNREEATQLFKKHNKNQGVKEYFIETYQLGNITIFMPLIEKFVNEIEQFLKNNQIAQTFQGYIGDSSLKMIRLNGRNDFNKGSIVFLQENSRLNQFELVMQNTFETFAPNKKKVKASGSIEIPFDQIWKTFGTPYGKLDLHDRCLIAYNLMQSYNLYIFETELQPDDYDRFKENAIIPKEIIHGCYERVFIGDNSEQKIPLTLGYIGIDDISIGIKATLYDIEQNKEIGMFFSIDEYLWKKDADIDKYQSIATQVKDTIKNTSNSPLSKLAQSPRKHQKKYKSDFEINTKYYLANILNKWGWRQIQNAILVNYNSDNKLEILGRRTKAGYSVVERLENIINLQSFLEIYKYQQQQ